MSTPPSRPTQYFQGSFFSVAIPRSASARWRAPVIISSRDSGVWRTPLGTSKPTKSKSALGPRRGAIKSRDSRTAPNFGLRMLPTATIIFSIGDCEPVNGEINWTARISQHEPLAGRTLARRGGTSYGVDWMEGSENMERDKRIELSPPPWQGGVLPLYESRLRDDRTSPEAFIARRLERDKARSEA